MSDKSYYVTTPIYYVNDKPHIGHAYTTILADVLANYHRLLGVPTYFLTGTDEHGQKVQQAADKNGLTPQQQCDQTVVRFQELWKRLEITNDDFIRTTEDRHKVIVQEVLQDLYDRDEIYRADYQGWYCVACERFFAEKDLVDGNCPECGRKVDAIQESNYFFRMSKYQDWLIDYIETHPEFIQPDFRANETLGFLKTKKLQDLCISRPKSRLAWGIDLPFDKDFVTYVWFDALLNYITAIGYHPDETKRSADFSKWWPATHQLIGKDILTTHTVYWPTMLKAMNVPLPKTVFAHGWWLTGRTKMSKSLGNVVNPMEMVDRYGVDAFRYFLIAEMTLGQDASFTEEAFVRRYNSDLANDLGNLLSRTVNMLGRYCDGKFPAFAKASAGKPTTGTKVSKGWKFPEAQPVSEALLIPSRVNYVGRAINLFDNGYKLDGSALVITKYLRTAWLWEKVRVQGGAYGAVCGFDPNCGVLAFASYRDPNLTDTLDAYGQTANFLKTHHLDEDELTRALIGAIGGIDTFLLPDAEGYVDLLRYLTGQTDERRQKLRDELLSTTTADFKEFADFLNMESAVTSVLGSSDVIKKSGVEFQSTLKVL
jgi:methionine--tRNA ligase